MRLPTSALSIPILVCGLAGPASAQVVLRVEDVARHSGDTVSFGISAFGNGGRYAFGEVTPGAPDGLPRPERVALFTLAFEAHLNGLRNLAGTSRRIELRLDPQVRRIGIYVVGTVTSSFGAPLDRKPDYFEIPVE